MAIQPMALSVATPEVNALGAMSAGQQAGQQAQANNLQLAQQTLQNVGALAFGVMDGKLDGQADPARWEQALDMIGQQGVNVETFRGRPDLAPVIARASVDTLGQLQLAQNEEELQQRMAEFDLKVQEAMKGPAPTADMLNFQMSQQDPAFAAYQTAQNAPNPPTGVAEYNFYADQERAAGREPLTVLEFEQAKKGQGFSVTTADGTTVQMGGNSPKLTEGQGKDIGFYTRGAQANQGLQTLEGELTNWGQQNASAIPLGLGNYVRSPAFRQAKVEADNFLTALLRKDTGAAITDQEFELYGPMFLPIPGDDAGTIALKRQKRATALMALRSGLGTAEIVAATNEQALGLPTPTAEAAGTADAPIPADAGQTVGTVPTTPATTAPEGVAPEVWEYLTPEERALWN